MGFFPSSLVCNTLIVPYRYYYSLCDFVLDGGTDAGGDSQEYNHIIEN